LSSTTSEDTLALVAWSTNIAWSHDLDDVFGTHRSLQPDLLAEQHVITVLADAPDLAEASLRDLTLTRPPKQ
jgi:hypothetical protein